MEKLNILNVSPIQVYPPKSGGQLRTHNLNMKLSKNHKIFLFSQVTKKSEFKFSGLSHTYIINNNYTEYQYANIQALLTAHILHSKWKIVTIFYDKILKLFNPKMLKNKVEECDIIQTVLPYQFKYLYDIKPEDKPIILDEYNVEYDLRKQIINGFLPNQIDKESLSDKICKIFWKKEKFAVENADVVFMVSEEDRGRTHELYNIPKSKIHVIPNGTNIPKNILNHGSKEKIKEKYGFKNKKLILFTGSTHLPNIEAVNKIIEMSKSLNYCDEILFLVVGSIGDVFKGKKYKNILFTGLVEDITDYFKMADIAINPMLSGSGTNIKVLEYMSYRLPIITTKVGARGLDIECKNHAIICDIKEFPYWIETLLNDEDLRINLGNNARKLAEEKYDWEIITEKVNKIYKKLV
jgi:glycosyltransferase involved in cell wall biosynthesis